SVMVPCWGQRWVAGSQPPLQFGWRIVNRPRWVPSPLPTLRNRNPLPPPHNPNPEFTQSVVRVAVALNGTLSPARAGSERIESTRTADRTSSMRLDFISPSLWRERVPRAEHRGRDSLAEVLHMPPGQGRCSA